MESIDDIVKFHENFIKKIVKERGSLTPQISFCKDNLVTPVICLGGREIKGAILLAKINDPDWIVIMYEGYQRQLDMKPNEGETRKEALNRGLTYLSSVKHGDLERAYKLGDRTVKDSIILIVYKKNEKRMLVFEKLRNRTLKKLDENYMDEFSGYLTLEKKSPIEMMKEKTGDKNANSKRQVK